MMSADHPTVSTRATDIAAYADASIGSRSTRSIAAQVDPPIRRQWDDLKADASERMGYDSMTNELFVAMLLDVYQHHLETDDSEEGTDDE